MLTEPASVGLFFLFFLFTNPLRTKNFFFSRFHTLNPSILRLHHQHISLVGKECLLCLTRNLFCPRVSSSFSNGKTLTALWSPSIRHGRRSSRHGLHLLLIFALSAPKVDAYDGRMGLYVAGRSSRYHWKGMGGSFMTFIHDKKNSKMRKTKRPRYLK